MRQLPALATFQREDLFRAVDCRVQYDDSIFRAEVEPAGFAAPGQCAIHLSAGDVEPRQVLVEVVLEKRVDELAVVGPPRLQHVAVKFFAYDTRFASLRGHHI